MDKMIVWVEDDTDVIDPVVRPLERAGHPFIRLHTVREALTILSTQEKYGMATRLFIGNLSYDVTEAELRAHFAALGPLSALALPMDRDTGKPRGFAFVEFRERVDAEEAIRRFNTALFKGRPLAVSEALVRDGHATPRAPRPAAPRPPSSAAVSGGDDRDFGPAAVPRRRYPPTKRAAQAERQPKHPIYKRAAGPVRFSADDDGDEEAEGRSAHGAGTSRQRGRA